MEQVKCIVLSNMIIAKDTYEMVLKPSKMIDMNPGQFVNIQVDGFILRRPFGLCEIGEDTFTILYKVIGEGTKKLSEIEIKSQLDILMPLGTSFPIDDNFDEVLIIGGGIGIAPLYEVARRYRLLNTKVIVILGFSALEYVYYEEKFTNLGCQVYVATDNGSYGVRGNVMNVVDEHNLKGMTVYSCGTMGMLKSIDANFRKGYMSFESRMACGIGACMGCVCQDKDNDIYYRICKEGPVFELGKVAI